VIDDGSSDKTVEYALNAGADKIVSHGVNRGVGAAFMTGIRNAVSMNADLVVTIDADMQFDPVQIPSVILPLLNNQADIVIGSRFIKKIPSNYSKVKLLGNKIFNKIISLSVGQKFTDTQTGFVAYSKDALLNISVVNELTWTQEVLIDMKYKGYKIIEVPVTFSYDPNRKSRVVKSIFDFSWKTLAIIIRSLTFHRPILTFGILGGILIGGGILAKILTITEIFGVSAGLSTGFIILGIVSGMLGLFASMVFKRQEFSEKDLRHYIKEFKKLQNEKDWNP